MVFAAAALSALTLRTLLLPRLPALRRLSSRLRLRFLRLACPRRSRPPIAPPLVNNIPDTISITANAEQQLDAVATRTTAQLDAVALAEGSPDYAALTGPQRRALLARAFAAASTNGANDGTGTGKGMGVSVKTGSVRSTARMGRQTNSGWHAKGERASGREDGNRPSSFWRVAESVNGRAAALGFALCLAREVLEPGHPSLFEQVVDVVVPIAASTPPFLVAVCDRLADLLT